MTASARLTEADEAILEALGRRLGAIDGELPRLGKWRSDRMATAQLHVVRGRTRRATPPWQERVPLDGTVRRRRPLRLDAAAAAFAALAILGAFAMGRDLGVGRPSLPTAPTPPGPAFSLPPDRSAAASNVPTPAATKPAPTPTPTRPPSDTRPPAIDPAPATVEAAGLQAVLSRMDWPCGVLVQVGLTPLPRGLIDKLALTDRDGSAVLPETFGQGVVATDPLVASRLFKGRLLLTDAVGSLWVLRGVGSSASVLQVVPERSPSRATVWRAADLLLPAPCMPPGTDAKTLIGKLPPFSWPAGAIGLSVVRTVPLATSLARPQ